MIEATTTHQVPAMSHSAKYLFMYLILTVSWWVKAIITFTLEIRKLCTNKLKWPIQGQTTSKWTWFKVRSGWLLLVKANFLEMVWFSVWMKICLSFTLLNICLVYSFATLIICILYKSQLISILQNNFTLFLLLYCTGKLHEVRK